MRSQLAVRLGSQVPVVEHLPPDVASLAAAEEAIELADAYGICDGNPLAESQKITLRAALGERSDGLWAATRVGDFGPRQGTGKNDKIAARELAGLILFGEQLIIHTAHEFPTANEAFLRLVAIFENYDDLRRRVARVRYANGEQGIELLSGQRLKYKARTGGSGRGFAKADLLVYDEAQHLGREHLAASAPAKLSNPNSQSWYAGSGGLSTSVVAWGLRRAAILGTGGRLAYTEMTGETVDVVDGHIITTAPDPSDMDAWYRSMPGLGRWVTEEGMHALQDELKDQFSRECLCVWDPEPGADSEQVFPAGDWEVCRDPDAVRGPAKYAIEVDQDGYAASICASDGTLGLVLEWDKGSKWLPAMLKKILDDKPGKVFLHPKGPTAALLPDLDELGIEYQEISESDLSTACTQLYAAVVEDHSFRHSGQQVLDIAVEQAVRRPYGNSWVWERRRAQQSTSPLTGVTIARWAALQVEQELDPVLNVW